MAQPSLHERQLQPWRFQASCVFALFVRELLHQALFKVPAHALPPPHHAQIKEPLLLLAVAAAGNVSTPSRPLLALKERSFFLPR